MTVERSQTVLRLAGMWPVQESSYPGRIGDGMVDMMIQAVLMLPQDRSLPVSRGTVTRYSLSAKELRQIRKSSRWALDKRLAVWYAVRVEVTTGSTPATDTMAHGSSTMVPGSAMAAAGTPATRTRLRSSPRTTLHGAHGDHAGGNRGPARNYILLNISMNTIYAITPTKDGSSGTYNSIALSSMERM